MYKTTVTIEILSDEQLAIDSIDDLIDAVSYCSIEFSQTHRKLSKRSMYLALQKQNSDPEFLLGDEAWLYNIQTNDKIYINNREILVSSIDYYQENDTEMALVVAIPYEVVKVPISEISAGMIN